MTLTYYCTMEPAEFKIRIWGIFKSLVNKMSVGADLSERLGAFVEEVLLVLFPWELDTFAWRFSAG